MGNIGGTEIILILLVALLLFGAKGLPKMARNLGKTVEQFRRAARDVTHEVMNADRDDDASSEPRQITGGEQVARSDSSPGVAPETTAPPAAAEAKPDSMPAADAAPVGGIAQKGSPDHEGRG